MAKNIDIGGRLHSVATEHIVTGADEIQDDTLNKNQAQINEEVNNTLEIHSSVIEGLNSQNYVSVDAFSELPELGSVNTVYRVGSWDGEQVDTTKYAEYAWINTGIDQGNYVLLDVKNYGIDDVPQTNSDNVVKSQGIKTAIDNVAFSTNEKVKNVGIDDEPTAGSENLVKSKGVYNSNYNLNQKIIGLGNHNFVYTFLPSNNPKVTLSTPITLSTNGDSLEFTLISANFSYGTNDGYGFASRGSGGGVSIGIWSNTIRFRFTDNSWFVYPYSGTVDTQGSTYKIVYENNGINLYRDGVIVLSQTGQKTLTINYFGHNTTYGYWSGVVSNIKVNGNYFILDNSVGSVEGITVNESRDFLSEEQHEKLDTILPSFIRYDHNENKFTFFSSKNGKYFGYEIGYSQSETNVQKVWRLMSCAMYNENLSKICNTLYSGENEFTAKFYDFQSYQGFIGGYHGGELVDGDENCFINFFIDGNLVSDSMMENDFEIPCNTFSYIEYTTLNKVKDADGEDIEGHPIFAHHSKHTKISNGIMECENIVKFTEEVKIKQYFSGLVCVHKNVATNAILPVGRQRALTASNSNFSANYMNDSKVILWNPNYSCMVEVSSEFVDGLNFNMDNTLKYEYIWDRANDSKYYRYIFDESVSGGNIIKTAGEVVSTNVIINFI